MTRPPHETISRVLRRARLPGGRRHQRRQRDPGRLPRLRHARRDHRARAWSRWRCIRCCADSGRRAKASSRRRSSATQNARVTAADDLLVPAVLMRGMFARDRRLRAVPAVPRAQPPGRRLRRRHRARGRRSSCSTWPAARAGSRSGSRSGPCADGHRARVAAAHGRRRVVVRASVPHVARRAHRRCRSSATSQLPSAFLFDIGVFLLVVGATALFLIALAHQSLRAHRDASGRYARAAMRAERGRPMNEIVVSLAIGVLAGSGVWLLLRPRTFQVAIGLSLLSYAVNLFIFAMGRLARRRGAHRRRRRGRRSGRLRRSAAAGAGADGDRDQLRDDGAAARRAAGGARLHRHRPRRRRRSRTDERRTIISSILPIVLPLAAGAITLVARRAAPCAQGGDQPRRRARCSSRSASRLTARGRRSGGASSIASATGRRRSASCWSSTGCRRSWCCSPRVLGVASLVFSLARWQRAGPRFHAARAVPADGRERRIPHRRPVQPVRVLRGAAHGIVWPRAARLGRGCACAAGLHYITVNLAASLLFLIGVEPHLRRRRNAQHGGPRAAMARGRDRRPRAVRSRRRDPRHRLPRQGRHVAAVLLAARRVFRRERAGGRAVRRADARSACTRYCGSARCSSAPTWPRRRRRAHRGSSWRAWATLAYGALGVLASQDLPRLASYSVLVSSGTLLAAIAIDNAALTGAALYYLVVSTLALSRVLPAGRARRAGPTARCGRAGRDGRGFRRAARTETDEDVGTRDPGGDGAARRRASLRARSCWPACRRWPASSASSRCWMRCSARSQSRRRRGRCSRCSSARASRPSSRMARAGVRRFWASPDASVPRVRARRARAGRRRCWSCAPRSRAGGGRRCATSTKRRKRCTRRGRYIDDVLNQPMRVRASPAVAARWSRCGCC